MATITVQLPVTCEQAFAYLADPRNRPAWQSTLRSVADLRASADPTAAGVTWTDVTVVPGVRPRMRTTLSEPPYHWVEEGRCGPFRARLALRLVSTGAGTCAVTADFAVHGLGLGRVLTAGARRSVAADLRRAGAAVVDRDRR